MAIDEHALTCKELVELVSDYLEGSLASEDKERFDQHLTSCDGCIAYLEQMRMTVQSLGSLREDDLTAEAKENLLRQFRDWNTKG